jgi:hypothetical protein
VGEQAVVDVEERVSGRIGGVVVEVAVTDGDDPVGGQPLDRTCERDPVAVAVGRVEGGDGVFGRGQSATFSDRTDKVVWRGCSSRAAQARNSNVYLRGVSGVSLSLAGRVGSGRAATLCSRANPPAESTTNRQPRLTANQRARSAP